MSLQGDLQVDAGSDAVEFTFTVENAGDDAVEMQFSDSQTFDVVVEDDGGEVWRFAEGMMFAQMLQSERLAAGEAVSYDAEWDDPAPGEYTARATLTANDADCEATASFSV